MKKIIGIVLFLFIPLVCFASDKDIYKVCELDCDATFQPQLHGCNVEFIHVVAEEYYNCLLQCKKTCERHGGSVHRIDDELHCVKIISVK